MAHAMGDPGRRPELSAEADGGKGQGQSQFAQALNEVTQRTTTIVREEIELAKVEVTAKATTLAKGAAVGAVAGVFALIALFFLLHFLALLLGDYLFGDHYAWGYLTVAVLLLVLGGVAGLLAKRFVSRGAPPVPKLAIDEAKRVKETVQSRGERP